MPKLLLIHGFEGSSKVGWLPWLEEKASSLGYFVYNVDLPNSDHPDFDEVMQFLREICSNFSDRDSVMGHSLGGFWAGRLAMEFSFNKLILIAPAIGSMPFNEFRNDLDLKYADIDALEKIVMKGVNIFAMKAKQKIVLYSLDDPIIPIENEHIFGDGWKKIILPGKGHFDGERYDEILETLL